MLRTATSSIAPLLFLVVWFTPVAAQVPVDVGQWIQLKATSPQGVPLHREPRPTLVGRAPDGTRAEILALEEDAHWLQIRILNGATAWIIDRYVARVVDPPSTGPDPADQQTVWGSPAGCQSVVVAGRRAAPTRQDVLRMGTWNIRWFPDETNVTWLACVIAWMNVDVLAVEEIRDSDVARTAMAQLLLLLRSLTTVDWSVDLHECGQRSAQHVGFLWNTTRATLSDQRDLWEMNPRASATSSPCAGGLRPGRYARVVAAGGGVDFHAVVVHSKSGSTAAARAERVATLARLAGLVAGLRASDEDIIVLGDFNTMGDGQTGSAQVELEHLFTTAAATPPGLVRLPVQPSCSEYFQGRPGWIDHVLVSRLMAELAVPTARLNGYCAIRNCGAITGTMPAAYQQLSDHCPVVVEIRNVDVD